MTVFILREDEDKIGRGMYPVNVMRRKSESRITDSAANKLCDLGKVTPPACMSGAFLPVFQGHFSIVTSEEVLNSHRFHLTLSYFFSALL